MNSEQTTAPLAERCPTIQPTNDVLAGCPVRVWIGKGQRRATRTVWDAAGGLVTLRLALQGSRTHRHLATTGRPARIILSHWWSPDPDDLGVLTPIRLEVRTGGRWWEVAFLDSDFRLTGRCRK